MSGTSGAATARHLVARALGSLSRRPPGPADQAWVRSVLTGPEFELWARQRHADQRHAVGVARGVAERLPGAERPVLAAALLHDIGKLDADVGVPGRTAATLIGRFGGARARRGQGRVARYLDHEAIGASWCAELGSDPVTVALVARSSASPADALAALCDADDSAGVTR